MRNILTLFSFAAIVLSLFFTVVEAQYVPPGAAEPAKQKGNPGSQPYVPPGSGASPGAYVPPGGGGLPEAYVPPGGGDPGAYTPGGGYVPGGTTVTGWNLYSVKKVFKGNNLGLFHALGEGKWQEASSLSNDTRDWKQVAASNHLVVLQSGDQFLKIDLQNKQISFCQPTAPYVELTRLYDLSEPQRTPPGWGQQGQSLSLNPVGKWLKGPPGIKEFEPEIGLHMEVTQSDPKTLSIALQSGAIAEYSIPVPNSKDFWGTTLTWNNKSLDISSFRLMMIDANTIMEISNGHISYMKRNVAQLNPSPIPNVDFGGTWVKGKPGDKNPIAGTGPVFTFSRTLSGLEMHDPSGSKATYRSLNGFPQVFMGQQILDASGQPMQYGDVTGWRIFLISPDTMIQTANGLVYYLKKIDGVVGYKPLNIIAGTGSNMTNEDRDEMLRMHNQERAAVARQPVTWSNEIAQYAQQWADQLAANRNPEQHRDQQRYGENLAWGTTGRRGYSVTEATQYWVNEKPFYTFGGPINDQNGHYTQMIWGNTQRIGCGKADYIDFRGRRCTVYVCNYYPPGNVIGQTP